MQRLVVPKPRNKLLFIVSEFQDTLQDLPAFQSLTHLLAMSVTRQAESHYIENVYDPLLTVLHCTVIEI
jgi:hypothetical protein